MSHLPALSPEMLAREALTMAQIKVFTEAPGFSLRAWMLMSSSGPAVMAMLPKVTREEARKALYGSGIQLCLIEPRGHR